jgi:hypothetical protein
MAERFTAACVNLMKQALDVLTDIISLSYQDALGSFIN